MLKGHVFSKQLFGNPIFALFINTFLNGENGVSDNYGSGMELSYSGSNVTIGDGAVCIQGRFIEEDSSTTINVGTDNNFCKLVLEVNLDVENTTTEFNQGIYKVIKNAADYPTLTQGDIVKNNSGIYQYELARFKNSSQGITDFQDRRNYLDFNSIYAEIRQHIRDIDDGSAFQPKDNFVTLRGLLPGSGLSGDVQLIFVDFPTGFTKDNCVVISTMISVAGQDDFGEYEGRASTSFSASRNKIGIEFVQAWGADMEYKVTLMKLPTLTEGTDYTLGDVNGDGQINQTDIDIIRDYIAGNIAFTDKQFKAADVNRDGVINTGDTFKIQQYINGVIDHF